MTTATGLDLLHEAQRKRDLRTVLRQARLTLDGWHRERATQRLCARVARLRSFRSARRIGAYLAAPGEVEVARLIADALAAGKEVYVPLMRADDHLSFVRFTERTRLAANRFGLYEPVHPDSLHTVAPMQLDLVLTPLVGFDDAGNRLGMGGGYYDRTFAPLLQRHYWQRPQLVGVAFECQRVTHALPREPWDIPLRQVMTESARYPHACSSRQGVHDACSTG
ncbi:MAG: 5-formyltetrahydrofolate cyclo-ligase [Pseudomonadota bacterium]